MVCPPDASGLNPPWWAPGYSLQSAEGQRLCLQDFSYAGYHNGEAPLPDTTQGFTEITVGGDPTGVSDSSGAFQSAINSAENAASITGGCIINIPAGGYRLETPLVIDGSGVILKGAGKGLTKLSFPTPGENHTPSIHFKGNVTVASAPYDFHGSEPGANRDHYLYLERDGSTYYLNPAYGFNQGKPIDAVVSFKITQSFINAHDMGAWWTENDLNQRKDFFRTEITYCSDQGSRYLVKIKAPLRYDTRRSFEYTDTQPQLRVYRGYLEECGIEDLSVCNAVSYKDAWNDTAGELRRGVYAVQFEEVKACWIRNVESYATDRVANTSGSVLEDDTTFDLPFIGGGWTWDDIVKTAGWVLDMFGLQIPDQSLPARHLQSGGIRILHSKRVTVTDSTMRYAQNRGPMGNGYGFCIYQSNEVLIRNSTAEKMRHNFITNGRFGTSGNVFSDITSSGGWGFLGYWDDYASRFLMKEFPPPGTSWTG